jgi:DNA anti-recombination protein RmuC
MTIQNSSAQRLQEPIARQRTTAEQLVLNRHVVAFADAQTHEATVEENLWERRGLLQALRRRPRLHRAA